MNMVNKSTGFTSFQLRMGHNPHIIPPLLPLPCAAMNGNILAWDIIKHLQMDVSEAQDDNLLHMKIMQVVKANKHHSLNFPFTVGSHVHLTNIHRCTEYKTKAKK